MEEYDKPEGKTLDKVLDVSNKVCKSLAKMYMRGFAIDKDVLEEVKQDFETELSEIEDRLQSQVKRLMGDTPINLNSPEQVSQVIFSRILKNKKEWILAFDNVEDKDDFRKIVRDNSYLMVKTKASICHTCKGKGRVHKIKKDGTPFAKPSRCPDCDTRGYL